MAAEREIVLKLENVQRHYDEAAGRLEVLTGCDLELRAGEMVALIAPSGAGKSTLLHTAGLLERPDGGEVTLGGKPCGKLNDAKRTAIRRTDIGYVYQFHHLLPEFTALENVMIPQMIRGLSKSEAAQRARELLDYMRLGDRATHRPAELSGGEQQRVAIARAVANGPLVLLADEPTGNLDSTSGESVMQLLHDLNDDGRTIVMITHDRELASKLPRRINVRDGIIESDERAR